MRTCFDGGMNDPVATATNFDSEPWLTETKRVVGASNPWDTSAIMGSMPKARSSLLSSLLNAILGFARAIE